MKLETTEKYGHRFAYIRMFFHGTPVEVTIADSADYFKAPTLRGTPGGQTYKIWGTAVMLTADGQGEAETLRVTGSELILETEFGNFRVRETKDGDKLVYGMNNYKGVFLEPMGSPTGDPLVGEIFRHTYLEIASVDANGSVESYDTNRPETIEEARKIIAEKRAPKDRMSKSDNEYWASRRYAIRRVRTAVETLEISEPVKVSTACSSCGLIEGCHTTGCPNDPEVTA